MSKLDRRRFLGTVGKGMLVSAGGLAVVDEFHLFGFLHASESDRLAFGGLEGLVATMQDTSADALIPKLVAEVEDGTDLKTLAAAAALANARTFGGQDYTGYHCFMAIVPALAMASRLEGREALLPVLKVLHRNARQIQSGGGSKREILKKVSPAESIPEDLRRRLLDEGRRSGFDKAEAMFAALSGRPPEEAYRVLQPLVRDNIDVHQVVLAYRSWDMMRLTGEENAHVLLRQVLRHCIDRDEGRRRRGREAPAIRTLLPELQEQYRWPAKKQRRLDDDALDEIARFLFAADRDDAARRVAQELAEGTANEDIGEALSLAAVRLLLHDPGRSYEEKGKPRGSVHGASVGLHAADSANAWRGIANATDVQDGCASLVTAAWHGAGQSRRMDKSTPYHADARPEAEAVAPDRLLDALGEALRGGDQKRSCALAERYLLLDRDPDALVSLLIDPATEFDGALHHEKFFHTATVEFARTRRAFRHEHLVALARVVASGYGFEDAGFQVSRRVLGLA